MILSASRREACFLCCMIRFVSRFLIRPSTRADLVCDTDPVGRNLRHREIGNRLRMVGVLLDRRIHLHNDGQGRKRLAVLYDTRHSACVPRRENAGVMTVQYSSGCSVWSGLTTVTDMRASSSTTSS